MKTLAETVEELRYLGATEAELARCLAEGGRKK